MSDSQQFADCYACHAAVPIGAAACPACGAAMTRSAYLVHQATQRANASIQRLRIALVVGVLFSFAGGVAFATYTAGLRSGTPSRAPVAPRPVSAEMAQMQFYLELSEILRQRNVDLGLTNWAPGPEGALILEMAPPTRENPLVLWQVLSQKERADLMGFIGIAYTKALAAAGRPVDFARDGHPVVMLQYRGYNAPLATRAHDGRILVFRSPFDPPGGAPAAPADGSIPGSNTGAR